MTSQARKTAEARALARLVAAVFGESEPGTARIMNRIYEHYGTLKPLVVATLWILTPREEKVLRLLCGIELPTPLTLEQVGKEFDINSERVRQIEAKALRKLRHPRSSEGLKLVLDGASFSDDEVLRATESVQAYGKQLRLEREAEWEARKKLEQLQWEKLTHPLPLPSDAEITSAEAEFKAKGWDVLNDGFQRTLSKGVKKVVCWTRQDLIKSLYDLRSGRLERD
jgi:DNA-binding CsgD family transcriptional regulator